MPMAPCEGMKGSSSVQQEIGVSVDLKCNCKVYDGLAVVVVVLGRLCSPSYREVHWVCYSPGKATKLKVSSHLKVSPVFARRNREMYQATNSMFSRKLESEFASATNRARAVAGDRG